MENKYKIAIGVALLATSFAVGRFTVPVRVKTEIKEVQVEKKVTDKDIKENKRVETVKTEIVRPDGTKETTTKIIEDTKKNTDSKTTAQTDSSRSSTSETKKEGAGLSVAGLAGVNVLAPSGLIFGGHVQTSLLGPVTIGAFGLSNWTFGVSLGLRF